MNIGVHLTMLLSTKRSAVTHFSAAAWPHQGNHGPRRELAGDAVEDGHAVGLDRHGQVVEVDGHGFFVLDRLREPLHRPRREDARQALHEIVERPLRLLVLLGRLKPLLAPQVREELQGREHQHEEGDHDEDADDGEPASLAKLVALALADLEDAVLA